MTGSRLLLRDVRLPGQSQPVDVLCADQAIEVVGRGLVAGDEDCVVVDGAGSLCLPAFVDVHSHADGRAWAPAISTAKWSQGIAVEVVGNCGLGPAPSSSDVGWQSLISGVCVGVPPTWSLPTFGEYLSQLQSANSGVWPRLGSLLPYGSARASVGGLGRQLETHELDDVRRAVEEGLDAGALGVSLGLVYPPNDAATFEELTTTLLPLTRARRPLVAHVRSQANRWLEAIDEILRLAEALDVRLLISHLCVGGQVNQWKLPWVLSRLREARRAGLDVWFDQHPYSAGSTSLTQLLPARCLTTGPDGVRVSGSSEELRALLALPSAEAGWENYLDLVGADHVLIAGARSWPEVEGRTVAELQREWDCGAVDAVLKLLDGTGGDASIVLTELYHREAIEQIAAEPFGCFSTDSVHSAFPHPRLYGTYPYAFRTLCRTGVLTEREFVERSASRPAQILGLERIAEVCPGGAPDLVVVDAEQFGHVADYREPWQPVMGLRHLILGGALVEPVPHGRPSMAALGA